MKPPFALLAACLLLSACAAPSAPPQSGLQSPPEWQSAASESVPQNLPAWWQTFGSPELDRLVEQARVSSYEVGAAMARVRQAQADAVIAGGPLLPEISAGLNANREQLLRGDGYSQLNSSSSQRATHYFDTSLSASYEVDFWGGNAAARDSARQSLRASEFDRATVELTLLGKVADSYMQVLALQEQGRIAALNLANAENVQKLVQTRYDAGSATALELAQQKSLVATQQRQLPLYQQQAREALITLATLLGQPVQNLQLGAQGFEQIRWPAINAGLPSALLSRRPDIANAEAKLAAAQADVRVARAALLPKLNLTATLGSGADRFPEILRNPFGTLAAGLTAPIFNNGRLKAERDKATAIQDELLQTYRGAIIAGFGDVEKALNTVDGVDQQRRWQDEELQQARKAFQIAESRYQAGAEDLLTVLETQRTLYQAQDLEVQLRLQRVLASIALYKALGGGWQVM
ncbi:efflux transporter outer membrane subunit [Pseudomonas sp. MAFF 302030]|uniref:Efflux transporter outer membrane subunit n=1 Tax=Pseudomonas morbosilactucae TaxID=2938197 RepID=A0A9X2C9I9_9PSED|nr:efflux transporter outer membrane subunit [Pseudomonas morbosilactucae]MCK9802341.1 efflux transporter outer membrane subunit [Pseudomonas morbosilactucae]